MDSWTLEIVNGTVEVRGRDAGKVLGPFRDRPIASRTIHHSIGNGQTVKFSEYRVGRDFPRFYYVRTDYHVADGHYDQSARFISRGEFEAAMGRAGAVMEAEAPKVPAHVPETTENPPITEFERIWGDA